MLIGRYDSKVSDKYQIAFPKKFRELLGDKLIVTKGFTQYLIVVSEANWKTLLEGTEGKTLTSKSTRETQRFLLGNASLVELDSKGRCVLPEYLRMHAGITEDVVYAGIERFVEIWDMKVWEEHQKVLSENISSIAERLSEQDNRNG